MKCSQVRRNLCAYLDNEIPDGSEPQIAAHLGTCGRCGRLRTKLAVPRAFLRKLKNDPEVIFRPDMQKLLPAWHTRPVFGINQAVLVSFVAIIAFGSFYYLHTLRKPLPPVIQKTMAFIKGPEVSYSTLKPGGEAALDTIYPTLVNVGPKSWALVNGKASLSMHADYLQARLMSGNICVALSQSMPQRAIINAAGFQITSLNTEFFVQAEGLGIDIKLLQGSLMIKYGDARNLKAERLYAGQAAAGVISGSRQTLKVYNLTTKETAGLQKKVNQIKQAGAWLTRHPKKPRYEARDIRIEFWRGD